MNILPNGDNTVMSRDHGEVLVLAEYPHPNSVSEFRIFVDTDGNLWESPIRVDRKPWSTTLGILLKQVGWANMARICAAVNKFVNAPATDRPATDRPSTKQPAKEPDNEYADPEYVKYTIDTIHRRLTELSRRLAAVEHYSSVQRHDIATIVDAIKGFGDNASRI